MNYDEQKIEDYIFDRLGAEERAAFQFKIMKDKALKKEVETQRALQKIARSSSTAPPNTSSGMTKWFLFLAVVLIGALAFLLFNNKSNNGTVTASDNIEEPKQENKNEIKKEEQNAESKEQSLTEPEQSEKSKETIAPTIKIEPRPIADFSANDYLENFIGSSVRSNEISVDIEMADTFKKNNDQTEIKINGSVISKNKPELVVFMFSNKEKDYEDFKPLITADLNLIKDQDTDNEFYFSLPVKVDFKPGLYYVIIETKDDGEMIGVDKFRIRTSN